MLTGFLVQPPFAKGRVPTSTVGYLAAICAVIRNIFWVLGVWMMDLLSLTQVNFFILLNGDGLGANGQFTTRMIWIVSRSTSVPIQSASQNCRVSDSCQLTRKNP